MLLCIIDYILDYAHFYCYQSKTGLGSWSFNKCVGCVALLVKHFLKHYQTNLIQIKSQCFSRRYSGVTFLITGDECLCLKTCHVTSCRSQIHTPLFTSLLTSLDSSSSQLFLAVYLAVLPPPVDSWYNQELQREHLNFKLW